MAHSQQKKELTDIVPEEAQALVLNQLSKYIQRTEGKQGQITKENGRKM